MSTMPAMPNQVAQGDNLEHASFEQQLAWLEHEAGPNADVLRALANDWDSAHLRLSQVRDGLLSYYDDLAVDHKVAGKEVPAQWQVSFQQGPDSEGVTREAFLSKSRNVIGAVNRMLAKIEGNPKLLSDLVIDITNTFNDFEPIERISYQSELARAGDWDLALELDNTLSGTPGPITTNQDQVREAYRLKLLPRMRALNEHFARVATALTESVTETWTGDRGDLNASVPI